MRSETECRRLRIDDEAARDEATRLPPPPPVGSAVELCTVIAGGPGVFCECRMQTITGTETTGAAGTVAPYLTPDFTLWALNLGTGDPTGKTIVAVFTDFRWVFEFNG